MKRRKGSQARALQKGGDYGKDQIRRSRKKRLWRGDQRVKKTTEKGETLLVSSGQGWGERCGKRGELRGEKIPPVLGKKRQASKEGG